MLKINLQNMQLIIFYLFTINNQFRLNTNDNEPIIIDLLTNNNQ